MKYLTENHIIMLHLKLEGQTSAVELHNEELLSSVVNEPFRTFDSDEVYPTITEKAVCLGYGLIRNCPFVCGNKRIGAHAMLISLALNNIELDYVDYEMADIITGTAGGEKSYDDLLEWVKNHSL